MGERDEGKLRGTINARGEGRLRWGRLGLAALVALCLLSSALHADQTGEEPEVAPTTVVIMGTLHQGHHRSDTYTPSALKRILLALEPSAICEEIFAADINPDGTTKEAVLKDAYAPEMAVASEVAATLGIRQIGIEFERRNEYWEETGYWDCLRRANEAFARWLEALSATEPESETLRLAKYTREAAAAQESLSLHGPPEVVNSVAFDNVVRAKHELPALLLERMRAYPDYDCTEEWLVLQREWQTRNRAMADNIAAAARRFPGELIVVTTGADHRYILREMLSEEPHIVLKEFWEVLPEEVLWRERLAEMERQSELAGLLAEADEAVEAAATVRDSWQEAEQACQVALALAPSPANTYRLGLILGRMYTRQGRHEEGLAILPDDTYWGGLHRAFCLDGLGRREEAVAVYEKLAENWSADTNIGAWARRGMAQPTWPVDLSIGSQAGEVELEPTGAWQASASHTLDGTTPGRAMDGDLRTAWTTGPIEDGRWGQHPGQWFVLDFGTPQFVSRIVLEHQGTETFYISSWPREVRASVSADGAEWEEVEATPAGPLQPLLLEFEPARRVQALRLELLAEHQPECWDLHEVHVFAPAPRPGPTRK